MKLTTDTIVAALERLFQEHFRARCERRKTVPWLVHEGKPIVVAAYFGAPVNCIFEFDDARRLNGDRLREMENYPPDAPLGFDFALYRELCAASRTRRSAATKRQAAIDARVDLLPPKHGLNPTLRLAAAEIEERFTGRMNERKLREVIASLLDKRLSVHAGTTFLQLIEHPSGKPFTPRLGAR